MPCPSYFYSFSFDCISAVLLNTVVLSPNRLLKLQILCSLYLTVCAQHLQDSFLKRIGHKHPIHSFFKILSIKCSYSIFNREMICAIFESLLSCGDELTDYVESACDLLLVSTFMIIYKVRVGVDLVFLHQIGGLHLKFGPSKHACSLMVHPLWKEWKADWFFVCNCLQQVAYLAN